MTTKPKNKPMRKCIGCNEMVEKDTLIRVIDEQQRIQSRGAYICKKKECLEKVLKNRGLERSLKCKISDDFYNEIKQVMESL